jgi:hypothetical protein
MPHGSDSLGETAAKQKMVRLVCDKCGVAGNTGLTDRSSSTGSTLSCSIGSPKPIGAGYRKNKLLAEPPIASLRLNNRTSVANVNLRSSILSFPCTGSSVGAPSSRLVGASEPPFSGPD